MVNLLQHLLALLAVTRATGFAAVSAQNVNPYNYTIINGQIFTPGLAIVDAPQPNTPLGGDFLQVALDVSYDGAIGQPPYPKNAPSQIYNITIFLFSYINGKNFTITNGTASAGNGSLGNIMQQEPGSTVKHVNWNWPDCLVGDGKPSNATAANSTGSARGAYNISMHQSFRLNGSDYYTIFDLPIQVTNKIPASGSRPACDSLNNAMLPTAQGNATGPPALLPYSVPKSQIGAAADTLEPQFMVMALMWLVFVVVMLD